MNDRQMELLNPYIYYVVKVSELTHPDKELGYTPRCSRYYEVEWITKGEGKMLVDGKSMVVKEGDVLFREPGTHIHAFGNYNCILVMFDPVQPSDEIKSGTRRLSRDEHLGNDYMAAQIIEFQQNGSASKYDQRFEGFLPAVLELENIKSYESLLLDLVRVYSQHEGTNHIEVKIAFLKVFSRLAGHMKHHVILNEKGRNYARHRDAVEKIQKIIEENPSDRHSLESLSKAVGISPYHMSRLFKQYVGMNISAYHRNARLDLAKHLLIGTDLSIESIAEEAGYDTSTYFYRVFRSDVGMTPGSYREQFVLRKQ